MSQGFAREARIGVDLHVGETLYYTANDTFAKADHDGLYGVRVKVQAAGAAGGAGIATGAGECSSGAGGSGGGYAESIIEAADLDTSESITVGSGGSGNTTGTGGDGGNSSFGTHVTATGGSGGAVSTSSGTAGAAGPSGGGASGDLVLPGGAAEGRFVNATEDFTTAGEGGSSALGNPGAGGIRFGSGGITAAAGTGYGAGGSGAGVTESSSARAGGDGADGIVIVEVLYERKIAVDEDIHTQYLNDTRHNAAHGAGRWTRGSAQSIDTSTFTTVIWDSEVRQDDADNDFSMDTDTGILTINNTGWYFLDAGVSTGVDAAQALLLRVNSTVVGGTEVTGEAVFTRLSLSTIFYCSATDTVDVRFWHNQGTSQDIRADQDTHFVVFKVRE